jgi:HK97 family phage major capsid protein
MKVPFDNSSKWSKSGLPAVTNPAEAVAGTPTKGITGARTLTLTKSQIPLFVTEELLEDSASADAWIRSIIADKMAMTLDYEILKGGAGGFTAINGDTGYCATGAISATPTVAEIARLVNQIHPQYRNAEFYLSITDWNLMIGTFATSNNLFNQIIDVAGRKLMGKNVNVCPFLASGDVILVDLNGYVIIEPPVAERLQISSEVRFLEGELVFKLTHRAAGALIVPTQATGDSLVMSAAIEKS